jgi:alpha-2-macroglobulin
MSSDSPLVARAGRRRFWITVLCFAIANAAAWVVYDRHFAWRHHGTLRVESFEPGNGATVGPHTTVRWRFSADVIPTAAYGRDPGTITPAIPGQWTWENPRTLVFTTSADLPKATHVVFTLADTFLRTDTGATLPQPYVTTIDSTPLKLDDVRQSAYLGDDRYVLELHFSDRIAPGDLLQHLVITLPDGRNVPCQLHGQAADKIVRVVTDPIPAIAAETETTLQVRLTPGLIGLSGPLGFDKSYQTEITLGRSTSATQLLAQSPPRGQSFLLLKFNNTVDPATVKEILSLDPPIPFTIESDGDQDIKLNADFHPGTRYTAKLATPPPGADRARYPHPGQLAAFVPDRAAGVWFDTDQGYLSTAGNRALTAHTVNLEAVQVSITRMYDNNLVAWRNTTIRDRWTNTDTFSRPLIQRTIQIPHENNIQHDIRLSLDDLLPQSAAHDGVYRISVEPIRKPSEESTDSDDDDDDENPYGGANAAVTLSDIGLTAKQTRTGLIAWTTSLHTAKPLPGVRVRVFSSKNQPLGEALTNADGLATINDIHPAKEESIAILLADEPAKFIIAPTTAPTAAPSTQLTWLDLRHTNWELGDADTDGRPYLRTGQEAFIYTDRGVYRPGETVHLRAIVRGPSGSAPSTAFPIRWQIRRPDQHDWKSQVIMLNADGAASLDLALPTDLPTGEWTTLIGLPDATDEHPKFVGSAPFQVEEFIPNRLKVKLTLNDSPTSRYTITDTPLSANIQSDYLFGRPAAHLPLELTTRTEPIPFSPQGWPNWTFGDTAAITPTEHQTSKHRHSKQNPDQPEQEELDDSGHYTWPIDLTSLVDSNKYLGPWRLTATAAVSEIGGRAVTATEQIDVDTLPAYIGVRRADSAPAAPDKSCEFQLALVKPDGAPLAESNATLHATLQRSSWNTVLTFRDGRYHYDSTRVLTPITKADVTFDDAHATWSPTIPSAGSYVVSFREAQTGACTSLEFDATDGSPWDDNVSRENPEHVDVKILSPTDLTATTKHPSHIGDTINVLVASPFAGTLLLTVETDEIVQSTIVQMPASHVVVPVHVTNACLPNAFITATVLRPIDPNAKWRTHRAFGVTRLNIDPENQKLNIAITAPPQLRPHQSLDVGLTVTDNTGCPVSNAAVTVAAVDEGICALTDFTTPDPLSFFTADRALSVNSFDLYSLLMPESPKTNSIGGDAGDTISARHHSPVTARRVKPVALAWQEIHTDTAGQARANFSIPEFQGRLRIMAVAYNNTKFGSADKGITIRSPLLAQTTWPRFAAPGDRVIVPAIFFNNTNSPGSVSIQLSTDTANLLSFTNDQPPLDLPAAAQRQIELPIKIAQSVGVARLQLHATMNGETYDENIELPIRPAAPTLQYGGYAKASTTQPALFASQPNLLTGTDALQIQITPWPTLQLPQALDYLDRYPYGCVEQTTSTCFPLLVLGDIGKQLDPTRFDPDRIKLKIDAGIQQLIGMQTADGGLAMWTGENTPWPWASVYAAHFLVEARAAGYDVPEDFQRHLMAYVRHLLDTGTDDASQLETQSYAAYVLALSGKVDRALLNRLTELASAAPRVDDPQDGWAMRSDSRLMLSCAWLYAGRRDLADNLIPQSLPNPRSTRQSDGNLGSPIRDRALLINTLLQVQPDHPALPDLVQQLADTGLHRQWASTQDTAFAALAIGRYLHDLKQHQPYDSAELRLGQTLLAQATSGYSIQWNAQAASPTTQPTESKFTVTIAGAKGAIAHVSWLQTGVPLTPPPDAEHGMKIHRRYLSLDSTDLKGNVRSGQLVRVEIIIEAPPDQPNLVIEDLLPAGLEVENPRLETSAKDQGDSSPDPKQIQSFDNDRLDMRDDRVIIAGQMPNTWKARCTYLVRAVTPGIYVIPPILAEAMYDINTNALSGASGTLTVTSTTSNMASIGE